jgi:hypothetical protein
MFEPEYECKLCNDFQRVHPVRNGKVYYDYLIYCKCHPKAGKLATRPRPQSELSSMVDFMTAGLNDYLYSSGCGRSADRPLEPQSDFTPIKEELEIINKRINELPAPKVNKKGSYD